MSNILKIFGFGILSYAFMEGFYGWLSIVSMAFCLDEFYENWVVWLEWSLKKQIESENEVSMSGEIFTE
jgi:hypothetical protein